MHSIFQVHEKWQIHEKWQKMSRYDNATFQSYVGMYFASEVYREK